MQDDDWHRQSRLPQPLTWRHPFYLCASLVQNPMNLGALCRTAEVFRLHQLVLANLAIVQTPEFRKLAVSAHHWQPLAACPPSQLSTWITHHQASGVSVLALTRHPQAIALPDFHFPHQSALLLGRELTGIPADLVEQCDAIIAIPQFGQVESLNVHTAAAIAAYAYLCQQGVGD